MDYIPLYQHISWEKEIIDSIISIHELMHKHVFKPLLVISKSIDIIFKIGEHIDDYKENNHNSQDQIIFLQLTTYISKKYGEKITLSFLSKEAGISRNKCCELFRRFTNNTLNNYLTTYRINKSVELLKNTHYQYQKYLQCVVFLHLVILQVYLQNQNVSNQKI